MGVYWGGVWHSVPVGGLCEVLVGGSTLVLVAWFACGAGVAVVTGTAGIGGAHLVDVCGMTDADSG